MDELVNVVFTSPPYASQRKYDEASGFTPVKPDEYVAWYACVAEILRKILAVDGSYFLNIKEHCEDGQRHLYVKDLTIAHVRQWGWRWIDEFCWRDLNNGVPGGWSNRFKDAWEPVFHFARDISSKFHPKVNAETSNAVFDYDPNAKKSKTGTGQISPTDDMKRIGLARPSNVLEFAAEHAVRHLAPFPSALPQWFIRAFSDRGDIVLDPFLGSGSTLIAAEREGRRAAGIEISPAYVDMSVERWQRFTGKTAVHADTGEPFNGRKAA